MKILLPSIAIVTISDDDDDDDGDDDDDDGDDDDDDGDDNDQRTWILVKSMLRDHAIKSCYIYTIKVYLITSISLFRVFYIVKTIFSKVDSAQCGNMGQANVV